VGGPVKQTNKKVINLITKICAEHIWHETTANETY
jgi:hypothetical protein